MNSKTIFMAKVSLAFALLLFAVACSKPPATEINETESAQPEIIDKASPTVPAPSPDTEAQATALAKADLSKRLGIDETVIEVKSIEPKEWSDTSLGCPKPEMAYAQVITSGYKIILEVSKKAYDYRTNKSRLAVLCE